MNRDLNSKSQIPNLNTRFSRTFLVFSILVFFLFPCKYCLSLQPQDLYDASFFSENKKRIAIFPFRNNTDIPHLQESIPDVLREGLFKAGFFRIVEREILYKTVWRLTIADLVKIDNAGVVSSERFLDQEVDLFSRLKREEAERVSAFVDADYTIRGAANQFGDVVRVELELLDVYTNKILDSISSEVGRVEDIPNTIMDFVPIITGLCVQENIEEIADDVVGRYRGGLVTFETTVLNLKEIALTVPESIYANTQLIILYKERGLTNEAIDTCKSIVAAITQYNGDVLDILSRLGVDPFDILANFYDKDNRLQDAADVYANAIKTIPLNTAYYYKKLGIIFLRQGKYKDAIKALGSSVELNVRDFDVHYRLGIAYESAGRNSEALKEYKRSLKYSGGLIEDLPIEDVKKKIRALEKL